MTPEPDDDLGTAAVDTVAEDADQVVAVRRNILISAVVGALAALLGLAFLSRSEGVLDRPLGLLLLGVAAINLVALASWRVPVLVADDQGIRLRLGLSWRGLPWTSIRQVVVERADSPLREGRLVVVPRDLEGVSAALDPLAALHLRWNRFWYSAPLSLPLGITTLTDTPDLAADLRALSAGGTDVAELHGSSPAAPDEFPAAPVLQSVPDELPPPPEEDDDLPAPVAPLRELRQVVRADARLEPAVADPEPRPEPQVTLHAPAFVAALPDEVEEPRPAEVIGVKIEHAREMLDMSIEELSDRTRIRPHVLEAMERDDFGPCGGDVYARGHLESVARVLGLSLGPLMTTFEEYHAQGPINARRVFEAELSTGLSTGLSAGPGGGMRAAFGGGPRWSLLLSAVLCLTLVWGVARLFAGDPADLTAAPPGDSAVAAANHEPITSPLMVTAPMTVRAAFAPTHVVVRDRTGKILWSGDLALGGKRKVVGLAPFKVTADNGGAVIVYVKGKELGTVGDAGVEGTKAFG